MKPITCPCIPAPQIRFPGGKGRRPCYRAQDCSSPPSVRRRLPRCASMSTKRWRERSLRFLFKDSTRLNVSSATSAKLPSSPRPECPWARSIGDPQSGASCGGSLKAEIPMSLHLYRRYGESTGLGTGVPMAGNYGQKRAPVGDGGWGVAHSSQALTSPLLGRMPSAFRSLLQCYE